MNWTPVPSRTMFRALLVVLCLVFTVFIVCELLAVWTENQIWNKISSTALLGAMVFFLVTYVFSAWKAPLSEPPSVTSQERVRIQQRLQGIVDRDEPQGGQS